VRLTSCRVVVEEDEEDKQGRYMASRGTGRGPAIARPPLLRNGRVGRMLPLICSPDNNRE